MVVFWSAAGPVLLVIKEKVAHPRLGDPALVRVRCSLVRRARELFRARAIRNVDDGERVLVVVEANLTVLVLLVGAAVNDTLRVVDVAILADAACFLGTARIGNVEHPETSAAPVRGLGANSRNGLGGIVGNDVMAAAKITVVGGEVAVNVERGGVFGIESPELGEVKHLEAVVSRLSTNVRIVADDLHVGPDRVLCLCGQAAHVL